jgi:hypothetical protein
VLVRSTSPRLRYPSPDQALDVVRGLARTAVMSH